MVVDALARAILYFWAIHHIIEIIPPALNVFWLIILIKFVFQLGLFRYF
jgi:hypothetical protein